MTKLGIMTTFDDKGATLTRKHDGRVLATGSLASNGLYTLDTKVSLSNPEYALVANLDPLHHHLEHGNATGIKAMAKNGVKGIDRVKTDISHCVGCTVAKGPRAPLHKHDQSRASQLLEIVHSDIIGPLKVPSIGGARYIITFTDDYSNWTVQYTIRNKSEALDRFKKYKAAAERHTAKVLKNLHVHEYMNYGDDMADQNKFKILRSGNGGKYLSNDFKTFLKENGIKYKHLVAHPPQQDGVSKCTNRIPLNLVRTMIHEKRIEKRFWAEAFATAVYVCNRVTSCTLPPDTTPFHIWHKAKPNLSQLREFGAKCKYVVPKEKVKKLDPRVRNALRLG